MEEVEAREAVKELLEEMKSHRAVEKKLNVLSDMTAQFNKAAEKSIKKMTNRLSKLEANWRSASDLEREEWERQLQAMEKLMQQCKQMGGNRAERQTANTQALKIRIDALELVIEELLMLDSKTPEVEERVKRDALKLKEAEERMRQLLTRCKQLDDLTAELHCSAYSISTDKLAPLRRANAAIKLLTLTRNCNHLEVAKLRSLSNRLEELIGNETPVVTTPLSSASQSRETRETLNTAISSATRSNSNQSMTGSSSGIGSSASASNGSLPSDARSPSDIVTAEQISRTSVISISTAVSSSSAAPVPTQPPSSASAS